MFNLLPHRRSNPLLWSVIMVSVVVHVLALLVAGGITIYQYAMPPGQIFEEPLPYQTIDRNRLEFSIQLEDRQRDTRRPVERVGVTTIVDMTMPDVDFEAPVGIPRVAVEGLADAGRGGAIQPSEGLVIEPTAMVVFGRPSSGEKFLFIIDADRTLMVDARGGMPTYDVIKEELIRAVSELPTSALFNAMIYEHRRIQVWSDRLSPASQANKEAFAEWLLPVNTDFERLGVRSSNFEPQKLFGRVGDFIVRENYFPHHFFHALAAGFELTPDAVFWLSPDVAAWGRIRRIEVTGEAREEARRRIAENVHNSPFANEEEWREAAQTLNEAVSVAVREYKQRENQRREARGISPRVYSPSEDRELRNRLREQVLAELGIPDPRGIQVHPRQTVIRVPEREAKQWTDQYQRLVFDEQRLDRPTINMIIFKGADEPWDRNVDDRRVRDFVREFNGGYRVLRGLGHIAAR